MALSYKQIEEAVRQAYLVDFSDRLDESRCKIGDVDSVYDAITSGDPSDETDGLVLDFGGGTSRPKQSFSTIKWAWIISAVYLIRFNPDVEDDLREVVSRLPVSLQADPRLSQTTPKAYVTEIGDASIGKLNDVTFYLIPFYIEALDRSV